MRVTVWVPCAKDVLGRIVHRGMEMETAVELAKGLEEATLYSHEYRPGVGTMLFESRYINGGCSYSKVTTYPIRLID